MKKREFIKKTGLGLAAGMFSTPVFGSEFLKDQKETICGYTKLSGNEYAILRLVLSSLQASADSSFINGYFCIVNGFINQTSNIFLFEGSSAFVKLRDGKRVCHTLYNNYTNGNGTKLDHCKLLSLLKDYEEIVDNFYNGGGIFMKGDGSGLIGTL